MLKKLTAHNFRVYRKKSFTFSKHVTVITGPNDRGKSTIVNLIRWLTLNRPSGRSVVRRGAKTTRGSLQIGNVLLSKSLGRSAVYQIGDQQYRAFGTKIPEEVKRVSNVSELNFQRQHESSFWLALSPGQVAKELNNIVDLSAIDAIQSSLAKRIRETTAAIKIVQSRMQTARQTREQLAWIRRFDAELVHIERQAGRYRAKSHTLAHIQRAAQLAYSAHAAHKRLLSGRSIAHNANLAGRQWRDATLRYSTLDVLWRDAMRAHAIIAGGTIPHIRGESQITTTRQRIETLHTLTTAIRTHSRKAKQCQRKLNRTKANVEKLMGGRCPTCGGILTDQMRIY